MKEATKMKKIVKMPLRRSPQRSRKPASSLRARAATADEMYDDEEDYDSEEEPNMKFTHALFVVLVLHIIAVGGVFAFNYMKTRQGGESASVAQAPVEAKAATPPATAAQPAAAPAKAKDDWTGPTHTVEPGDTLSHIAAINKTTVSALETANGITSYSMLRVGQVLKIPGPETVASRPAKSESAEVKEAFLATKVMPTKAATISAVSNQAAAKATEPEASASTSAASGDVYVVQKGDNPYSIAKRLNVSYKELLKINNIDDPTKVQIGQKLTLP